MKIRMAGEGFVNSIWLICKTSKKKYVLYIWRNIHMICILVNIHMAYYGLIFTHIYQGFITDKMIASQVILNLEGNKSQTSGKIYDKATIKYKAQ